jgi:hypothetical protein
MLNPNPNQISGAKLIKMNTYEAVIRVAGTDTFLWTHIEASNDQDAFWLLKDLYGSSNVITVPHLFQCKSI